MLEKVKPGNVRENTARVEKLLFFKGAIGGAPEDRKSGRAGAGHGEGGRNAGVDGLDRLPHDGLAAGRAFGQIRGGAGGPMLEARAAEFARRAGGSIKMERHGKGRLGNRRPGFEMKQGERLEGGMSGRGRAHRQRTRGAGALLDGGFGLLELLLDNFADVGGGAHAGVHLGDLFAHGGELRARLAEVG